MYFLGYDLGSSSVKAALFDIKTHKVIASASYPPQEMKISSPYPGWAEQDPEEWWQNVIQVTRLLMSQVPSEKHKVQGIGISYQMHGLIVLDKNRQILRPAIIWCDSRATIQGEKLYKSLGATYCQQRLLNAPGNFTAAKLSWIRENEPEIFGQIDTIMLPGDFLAFKLTGEIFTTISGLSEGTFWDFENHEPAEKLLNCVQGSGEILPKLTDTFGLQGNLTTKAAHALNLPSDIPLWYRAGDQPNNALALGVSAPGEVAASGGTSGVVYGIADAHINDTKNRINSFAHVNHSKPETRLGVLLCINACGILYRWIRQNIGNSATYDQLELLAAQSMVGAQGLSFLPFGNGGERMLLFKNESAQLYGLDLNRHERKDLIRAGLEGVAFSFVYGIEMMKTLGVPIQKINVANDNLFQSDIFSQTIANLAEATIEMKVTTGAIGAAQAAAFASGAYASLKEATFDPTISKTFNPAISGHYKQAYEQWKNYLKLSLTNS